MSLDRFNSARLGLERFNELGFAVRRRQSAEPRGTILYIHGLGESSLGFEAVMSDSRLDGWNHLAIDLLGYGKSSWPERPFDLEQHAASIELLLDRLEMRKVVLVGHSMGSVIALFIAERGRVEVPLFIDIEGNVTFDDCTFSSIGAAQDEEQWLTGGYTAFLDRIHEMAEQGKGDDPSHERAQVMRAYGASAHFADPRTLHLDSVDLVRLSKSEKLAERRAKAGVPTVYFYGAPRGTGGYSLGQLEDAEIEIRAVEDAGHWLFLDQHDVIVEAMADLLPHSQ